MTEQTPKPQLVQTNGKPTPQDTVLVQTIAAYTNLTKTAWLISEDCSPTLGLRDTTYGEVLRHMLENERIQFMASLQHQAAQAAPNRLVLP